MVISKVWDLFYPAKFAGAHKCLFHMVTVDIYVLVYIYDNTQKPPELGMACVVATYSFPTMLESHVRPTGPAGPWSSGSRWPHSCSERIPDFGSEEAAFTVTKPLRYKPISSSVVTCGIRQASQFSGKDEYRRARQAESESRKYLQAQTQPWWLSQLAGDIHNTFKRKEDMLVGVKLISQQLNKR